MNIALDAAVHSTGLAYSLMRAPVERAVASPRAPVPSVVPPEALDIGLAHTPDPDPALVRIRLGIGSLAKRAAELVEKRYAWRGYSVTRVPAPDVCTFLAERETGVVGTMGVRLDGGGGLAADSLYGAELERLRAGGARLCEFTRLAVDPEAGRPVLARLFHSAYLYAALMMACTHVMIEVNPRHVPFYQRTLGFERHGEVRQKDSVAAPAVLLGISFDTIARGIQTRVTPSGRDHPIYSHFWTNGDAMSALRRMERALARLWQGV